MTSIANDDVENTTADTTKEKPTKEIETEEYLARKKLANETDFTEFEKQVVIGITDNIVVFTPRAAGENPDMNSLLNYMILKLDKVVENKYNLVYCHTGMSLFSRKHFSWLKSCYNLLGRKFKKNIAKLIIVHPSFIINAGFMFARPFISSKFWKKLHRESSITNVGKILNLVQPLKVAPVVYKYEGLDEPKLYFGAPLENQEKNNNSSGELPIYLESVTSFLLNNDALNIEGIFRIPGNAKGIERYINNIENGQNLVDIYENEATMETFSQVDHLHIIGGTLKAYLRDLPVPLFPFNSYQPLIDLMKEFNTNDNSNNMSSSTTSDNDMKAKMVPKEIKFIDDGMEILNTYCDEYNMKIIT